MQANPVAVRIRNPDVLHRERPPSLPFHCHFFGHRPSQVRAGSSLPATPFISPIHKGWSSEFGNGAQRKRAFFDIVTDDDKFIDTSVRGSKVLQAD
jgi:hypothetical protein